MSEPTTQAGRALLDRIQALNGRSFPLATGKDIAAIEAEAAAAARKDVATHPRWHHSPDAPPEYFCEDCDDLKQRAAAIEAEAADMRDAVIETSRAIVEALAAYDEADAK